MQFDAAFCVCFRHMLFSCWAVTYRCRRAWRHGSRFTGSKRRAVTKATTPGWNVQMVSIILYDVWSDTTPRQKITFWCARALCCYGCECMAANTLLGVISALFWARERLPAKKHEPAVCTFQKQNMLHKFVLLSSFKWSSHSVAAKLHNSPCVTKIHQSNPIKYFIIILLCVEVNQELQWGDAKSITTEAAYGQTKRQLLGVDVTTYLKHKL